MESGRAVTFRRMASLAAAVALTGFLAVGLACPLILSLAGAFRDPELAVPFDVPAGADERARAAAFRKLAEANGTTEAELRRLNGLAADSLPGRGDRVVVRPACWTVVHMAGLFRAGSPQWRWLLNSLWLAFWVTFVTTVMAIPLAYLMAYRDFPGRTLCGGLILLPLILPPFVGAIGIRRILSRFGLLNAILLSLGVISEPLDILGGGRFEGIVLVEALHLYPIMVLNLASAFSNIDPSLREAAASLGAPPWKTFLKVTLPLAMPGFFAGGSLVFVFAFTDLGTPLVFEYQELVAKQVYDRVKDLHTDPSGMALAIVVLAVALGVFAAARSAIRLVGGTASPARGVAAAALRPLRGARGLAASGLFVLISALAALPHLAVALTAFGGRWGMTALPESWTLEYMVEAFSFPVAADSIRNSLLYATAATAIDVVLGLAIAFVVHRGSWRWRGLLDAVAMAPLAVPGIVLAFGYVAAFGPLLGSIGAAPFLVMSYAVRRLPYSVRACSAGFEQTPVCLEEAARNLGENPFGALRRVTVPLIAANVLAGAILTFSFAMLEVSDSLILATRPADFPITKAIYTLFSRPGVGDSVACALGLVCMVLMALSLLAASALMGRSLGRMFRT
ncbi:MAG: iron ABC transporter permease [Planctomycetota bacterium]|nr:iron ABC transporter permease [Planctomycetota bacterium]